MMDDAVAAFQLGIISHPRTRQTTGSPTISLQVLYNMCALARDEGVTHIAISDLEQALDNFSEVTR